MYATLAAINDEITPIYTAEGLSVSFDTYSTERDKDLPPLDAGQGARDRPSARTGAATRGSTTSTARSTTPARTARRTRPASRRWARRCRTCAATSSA
jgi:hypothetical protein